MKKVLYFIGICGLALLMGACNGKSGDDAPTKPVITTSVKNVDQTRILEAADQTMEIEVLIEVQSGTVTEALTPVLKVDESAVAIYNAAHPDAEAIILPATAYDLEERAFAIARGGKQSATTLTLINKGLEENKLYVVPVTIDKMEGSSNWKLADAPQSFVTVKYVPTTQDGTAENPYLIFTVDNLEAMSGKLKDGEKIYFELRADIDMKDVEWTPLNYAAPYAKGIDFNGNGHTLSNFYCNYASYPSFFGVLNGDCYDVNFVNAKVEDTGNARVGILGGYCGTGDIAGYVYRTHIQGENDHTHSSKYGAGGFFAYLANGGMYGCSADVVVKSKLNNAGGLVGYCGKYAIIRDCWSTGTVYGNQRVGGIVGGTDGKDDPSIPIQIARCYSTATLHGAFAVGGIAGFLNKADNAAGSPKTNTPGNKVEYCIAWNKEIRANYDAVNDVPGTPVADDKSHYSCGAVVGYTAIQNYLTDCKRNPAMKYNEAIFFDYSSGVFSLYDQENASPASPLVITAVEEANHNYPYHGKAAAAGQTLSQVAQSLGWSDKIWDFSKDVPTILPTAFKD